jgi:hypothetical protein
MRPVQRFSDEYLEMTKDVSAEEIVRFLDDFRKLHEPTAKSHLISRRSSKNAREKGSAIRPRSSG